MESHRIERPAIIAIQCAELCLADARRIFQDCIEDRPQLSRRRADDLEHVGSGSLLLERLAQLVEQPCVLDGDDGLRSEALDQFDLLIAKRTDLLARNGHSADKFIVLQHRYGKCCSKIPEFDSFNDIWMAVAI